MRLKFLEIAVIVIMLRNRNVGLDSLASVMIPWVYVGVVCINDVDVIIVHHVPLVAVALVSV